MLALKTVEALIKLSFSLSGQLRKYAQLTPPPHLGSAASPNA